MQPQNVTHSNHENLVGSIPFHAYLCNWIEYSQDVRNSNYVTSGIGERPSLPIKWFFGGLDTCLDEDNMSKSLGSVFPEFFNKTRVHPGSSMLIALIQYEVYMYQESRRNKSTRPANFKELNNGQDLIKEEDIHPRFSKVILFEMCGKVNARYSRLLKEIEQYSENISTTKSMKWRFMQDQAQKNTNNNEDDSYRFVLDCNHTKERSDIWVYIVIVCMKRHLVGNLLVRPFSTVREFVEDAYTVTTDEIYRIFDIMLSPSDEAQNVYGTKGEDPQGIKPFKERFRNGKIPMANKTGMDATELRRGVESWFTWFLTQRIFSTGIMSLIIPKGHQKKDNNIEHREIPSLTTATLESTGFDLKTFIDTWLGLSKTQQGRQQLIYLQDGDLKIEDIILKKEDLKEMYHESTKWKELTHPMRTDDDKFIDTTGLKCLFRNLYNSVGVEFKINANNDVFKLAIADKKSHFRDEFFNTWILTHGTPDNKSPNKGAHTGIAVSGSIHDTEPSQGNRDGIGSQKHVLYWKHFERHIADFHQLFVKYNTRYDIKPDGTCTPQDEVSCIEARLAKSIKENLGIDIGGCKNHIPGNVEDLLTNIERPDTYRQALCSIVTMLSKNQNTTGNAATSHPLSSLFNTNKDWNEWSLQFDFFMYLLIASLLHDTRQGSSSANFTTLLNKQYKLYNTSAPGAEAWMTGSECRRYIYRSRCWKLMYELFGTRGRENGPCTSYTFNDILKAVYEARGEDNQDKKNCNKLYKCLVDSEDNIFQWQKQGYHSVVNEKNLVEHMVCIILIVAGVETLSGPVLYDNVIPPMPGLEKQDETGDEDQSQTPSPDVPTSDKTSESNENLLNLFGYTDGTAETDSREDGTAAADNSPKGWFGRFGR
jgi:hypothetical protein